MSANDVVSGSICKILQRSDAMSTAGQKCGGARKKVIVQCNAALAASQFRHR